MSTLLDQHAGAWSGTNRFRLMPSDAPYVAAATAEVFHGAAEAMAVLAYRWSHPDDGDQEGLLVVGHGESSNESVALWGDSWHQSPGAQLVTGTAAAGLIGLGYAYGDGDWQWNITLDARDSGVLVIQMDNVVPASAASPDVPPGAYAAMVVKLTRD